jgi:hypothetical protein
MKNYLVVIMLMLTCYWQNVNAQNQVVQIGILTPFSSAQFLFREYQQQNFLWSLCGCPIAIFINVYHTLNDKHWIGDVVIWCRNRYPVNRSGLLAFPKINGWIQGKKDSNASIVYPYYQSGAIGLGLMKRF